VRSGGGRCRRYHAAARRCRSPPPASLFAAAPNAAAALRVRPPPSPTVAPTRLPHTPRAISPPRPPATPYTRHAFAKITASRSASLSTERASQDYIAQPPDAVPAHSWPRLPTMVIFSRHAQRRRPRLRHLPPRAVTAMPATPPRVHLTRTEKTCIFQPSSSHATTPATAAASPLLFDHRPARRWPATYVVARSPPNTRAQHRVRADRQVRQRQRRLMPGCHASTRRR